MKIQDLLEQEVVSQVEELKEMSWEDDNRKTAVDGTVKYANLVVDLKKAENDRLRIEYEHDEKLRAQDLERERQETEAKDQKIKNRIAVAGIVVPTVSAIGISVYSWIKEEHTIMTSGAGRKAMDFLLRFKK